MVAIDPDIAVHVYAIETNMEVAVIEGGQGKGFFVPGGAAYGICTLFFGRAVFVERADDGAVVLIRKVFNAPVMRQLNGAGGVHEGVFLEEPVIVEPDLSFCEADVFRCRWFRCFLRIGADGCQQTEGWE